MTPVSSPTPDEQAAEGGLFVEWPRTLLREADQQIAALKRDLEDMTADRDSWEQQASDVLASWSDTNAALVVVREQLTQAQARIAAVEALLAEPLEDCAENYYETGVSDGYNHCRADVRAVLEPTLKSEAQISTPPSPPTYTREEPSSHE